MKILLVLFLIVACNSMQEKETEVKEPVVTVDQPTPVQSVPKESCIPVRDQWGTSLGVSLTLRQNCNLQLQGSGIIDGQMYNYKTESSLLKVDCSSVSSKIPGTVKFLKSNSKYGIGVRNWHLIPFKSIAVDPKKIPYGTDVYIEDLKGIQYQFEGKTLVHDGWVRAMDTGGVIKGSQIDFFFGPLNSWSDAYKLARNFPFIKSNSKGTFKAKYNGKTKKLWATFYYVPIYTSCK